jgi:hypothetical protein
MSIGIRTAGFLGAIAFLAAGCSFSFGTNTAQGNGATANAAAGAAGAAGGEGNWGVWAYHVGGGWDDPCAIQYVGAQIPGNRYDANPDYRRVRTRQTQQDADLDIDQFGHYHRDQPDGVVKMRSCEGGGDAAAGGGTGGSNPSGGANGGAAQAPDMAGVWRGGNGQGSTYTFTQNGNAVRWTRNDNDEVGTATITGTAISATYTSSAGSGSAGGTITLDSSGRAARIEWSNGDVYVRQ